MLTSMPVRFAFGYRKLATFGVILVITVAVVYGVLHLGGGLPREIRIAAGPEGGLYYETAEDLAAKLRAETGRKVRVIVTNGDLDNRRLLLDHRADVGMLQVNSDDVTGICAVAPLYDEAMHIIVRKGRGINSIFDLSGRNVALGPVGSGTRSDSARILSAYGITTSKSAIEPKSYMDMETNKSLDAAFITTGLLNPDVQSLMSTGQYSLLELSHPTAFIVRYPFYKIGTVPVGLYRASPPLPARDTDVVMVPCYLAARDDASSDLIVASLNAIYRGNIRQQIPVVMSMSEARMWSEEPMHPASQRFYDPYSELGVVSNTLEALSSLKELLAAFAALLFVLYRLVQNRKQAASRRELQEQKERLDKLIMQSIDLDNDQSDCEDTEGLRVYLARAIEMKNTALNELTHELLRGNQLLIVYILQITGVIHSIEMKLLWRQLEERSLNSKVT